MVGGEGTPKGYPWGGPAVKFAAQPYAQGMRPALQADQSWGLHWVKNSKYAPAPSGSWFIALAMLWAWIPQLKGRASSGQSVQSLRWSSHWTSLVDLRARATTQ